MTQKLPRKDCRLVTLCVDSTDGGVPAGRFYAAALEGHHRFHSLEQFLVEMEQLLDETDGPKAFAAIRTFQPPPETSPEARQSGYRPGTLATFSIRILFRQNASWQGAVAWLEGQQEQGFRSALELLILIRSALCCRRSA